MEKKSALLFGASGLVGGELSHYISFGHHCCWETEKSFGLVNQYQHSLLKEFHLSS